jgi:motility quorum-sensing regulator/GCU-specific mRNA interferase toxin
VEKRKPHHSLTTIKTTFATVEALRMTNSSRQTMRGLGMDYLDVVAVIQATTRQHFYKSMSSISDATVWQDVYHVPAGARVLYVKFTTDVDGYLLISFKER